MKVGYVRVSTFEQADSDALEQQTARVKKAGATHTFADIESGRSDRREQFNKMLELCAAGEVTEIIITRIDRLSRSVIRIHKTIASLEQLGVKLTILDAPIDDVSSPFGWFSASQMSSLAEFESRLLSSRIRHGFDYFREQKKASSRPPFGYARVKEKYAPDQSINEKSGTSNWCVALAIIDYFLSLNATTRGTINFSLTQYDVKWTQAGLRYWLLNPVLRGDTVYNVRNNQNNPENWIVHNNTHIPLISQETFELIKQRFEENRNKYAFGNNKIPTKQLPLQGQMICGCCGYKLFIKKNDKYLTYRVRCKKRDTLGANFCKNKIAIRLQQVIEAVDKSLISRAEEIANYTKIALPKTKIISPEILSLSNQLNSLKSLPKSDIIEAAIKQTYQEIARIEQQQEITHNIDKNRIELVKRSLCNADYWDDLPDNEKIAIYRKLVDSVKILNGDILEINLNF
ncbi:recombinase family protein [Plectonema cf. radiosum LEGE 06105]|uniref:Recombinase family protein n=1 Tax=Plectonema cf. radiosum LEGE 06105 TaxID=945769 RepID=A0A8J7JU20_9CYAN|nr:fdxN element excision recombinase XisF [Plectonema radiosum]MBE9212935.1 recombinase family protein [Plectonema cf. radiosum LEGE 06105]